MDNSCQSSKDFLVTIAVWTGEWNRKNEVMKLARKLGYNKYPSFLMRIKRELEKRGWVVSTKVLYSQQVKECVLHERWITQLPAAPLHVRNFTKGRGRLKSIRLEEMLDAGKKEYEIAREAGVTEKTLRNNLGERIKERCRTRDKKFIVAFATSPLGNEDFAHQNGLAGPSSVIQRTLGIFKRWKFSPEPRNSVRDNAISFCRKQGWESPPPWNKPQDKQSRLDREWIVACLFENKSVKEMAFEKGLTSFSIGRHLKTVLQEISFEDIGSISKHRGCYYDRLRELLVGIKPLEERILEAAQAETSINGNAHRAQTSPCAVRNHVKKYLARHHLQAADEKPYAVFRAHLIQASRKIIRLPFRQEPVAQAAVA